MLPDERLIPRADRLARRLAGPDGAQLLAELQKMALLTRAAGRPEPTGEPPGDPVFEQLAPAGSAHRVVVLGESTARGYLLDPVLTPTGRVAHYLDAAAPGGYQCVDLTHVGAGVADLERLVDRLPAIAPDTVVLFAGSNWTLPTYRVGDLEVLGHALERGGYAAMRAAFWPRVVKPRVGGLLAKVRALHDRDGTAVVVVIPEFNLRGWRQPPSVDTVAVPAGDRARWYALRDEAERAAADGRWSDVVSLADRLRHVDGGLSPVGPELRGHALIALGDGAGARAALEEARDAMVGLLVAHSPRVSGEVQRLLLDFARDNGFRHVDLRTTLASPDLPALPAAGYFLDYCHLSEAGMDRAAGAIATAVCARPVPPRVSRPALDPADRAVAHVLAACHAAYFEQPAAAIDAHLATAIDADPDTAGTMMTDLHRLLDGHGPVWAQPGVEALLRRPHAARYLGPLLDQQAERLGLWTLRQCLADRLGTVAGQFGTPSTAVDLLAGHTSGGGREPHRPPNLVAPRAYQQAVVPITVLRWTMPAACDATLTVTHRLPAPPDPATVRVAVNGVAVGRLRSSAGWAVTALAVPGSVTRPGINTVSLRWPLRETDGAAAHREAAHSEDVARLARGGHPFVLPVYGELFAADLALNGHP